MCNRHRSAAPDSFHIPILTVSKLVKYGRAKWKLLWVAPAPYFQKASYSTVGLVLAWAEVLSSLAPASCLARTMMGCDSNLAVGTHCNAVITSFQENKKLTILKSLTPKKKEAKLNLFTCALKWKAVPYVACTERRKMRCKLKSLWIMNC